MQVKTEPTDHMYAVLQNHGPQDGGWGTAALALPGVPGGPLVYGGTNEQTIANLKDIALQLARLSGKETMFVKFTHREDIEFMAGGGEKIEI